VSPGPSTPPDPLHAILGAKGVIGRELSRALAERGVGVRQVSRSPARVGPSDTLLAADLLDPRATANAVEGCEVAYLVAGLRYDAQVWEEEWPRVMRNAIDACARHRTRLVFFDNVYAYGRVAGAMTEETPFNPCSRKGEVRARIATTLLDAVRAGTLEGMIIRAADFYGPGAVQSLTHSVVFERIRQGKTPQWIGRPKMVHTFTYTPDAGRATAHLGCTPAAFGQSWHLPTTGEPLSGEGFVRLACELAKRPYDLQVAPRWLLRAMGYFNPILRENDEMMYQFEFDYRLDSGKIERAYGLSATPYREGITATLRG